MEPARQRLGQIIDGRYELRGLIGRGAMADVYRARDFRTARDVAVKILRQTVASDPDAVRRFRREAQVQQMVRHRNVAALHGGGVTSRREPYLVFELLRGRSLHTVLRRERRVSAERAVYYCIEALAGLAAVHTVGIHHRDLKPANLMLEPGEAGARDAPHAPHAPHANDPPDAPHTTHGAGPSGGDPAAAAGWTRERVVLIDFGFASLEGASKLTRQGHVVGSLSYLAPERLRGQPCDPRAEVYAMGTVLYELIAGRPPFVAGDDQALMQAHLAELPIAPSRLVPECEIPTPVEAVLLQCLAKEPAERPSSAAEMARALAQSASR